MTGYSEAYDVLTKGDTSYFSNGMYKKRADIAINIIDRGSIPRLGRSPGGGNDNPFQYSCLEDSKDRGVWQYIVQGIAKSQTQLSD